MSTRGKFLKSVNIFKHIYDEYVEQYYMIFMQELDNPTVHSIFLTKSCKPSHAHTTRRISVRDFADFADFTLKFNGFELNLKVFCPFLSDIYS